MPKRRDIPVALTIAGSDSGGGAGIQADLKTFASLGVHGTSAITCITAQNPRGVTGIESCRPAMVRRQIAAVFDELRPAAAKTGMLYSVANIRTVAEFFRRRGSPPLVVDPVIISTSGKRLLELAGIRALCAELLPLARLVTPNVYEAQVLTGKTLRSLEDLRAAAKELHQRFGCSVVVKGGHLRGYKVAADIFFDGREELLLSAPFVKGVHTHGTGCTFSAAVTAHLARGASLARAVRGAKDYVTKAISRRARMAGHDVLNHFA